MAALAVACLREGDVDTAVAAASLAVAAGPKSFDAQFAHGCALAKVKRSAEAIVSLRRAVDIDPAALGPHVSLGELYLTQLAYEAAAAELRLVLELDPKAETPEGARAQALVAKTLVTLG